MHVPGIYPVTCLWWRQIHDNTWYDERVFVFSVATRHLPPKVNPFWCDTIVNFPPLGKRKIIDQKLLDRRSRFNTTGPGDYGVAMLSHDFPLLHILAKPNAYGPLQRPRRNQETKVDGLSTKKIHNVISCKDEPWSSSKSWMMSRWLGGQNDGESGIPQQNSDERVTEFWTRS